MEKREFIPVATNALFPRANRLISGAEYDQVFKKADRSADQFFTVLYRRNASSAARLGLAIAKKRISKATARNRLKRLIRESFRQSKEQISGVDIVIMARSSAGKTGNQELFKSLERHWQKIAADINSN